MRFWSVLPEYYYVRVVCVCVCVCVYVHRWVCDGWALYINFVCRWMKI